MSKRNPRRAGIWLERSLAIAGALALAWVAVSWLDSRLYQASARAQLEHMLASVDGSSGALRSPTPAEDSRSVATGTVDSAESETTAPEESRAERRQAAAADPDAEARTRAPVARAAPLPVGRERPAGAGAPLGLLRAPRVGLSVIVAEGVDRATLRRAAGHLPSTPRPGGNGNAAIAAHRDTHFLPLKDLRSGDELSLLTSEGTFRYQVEWIRIVEPTAIEVLAPTDHAALTLITCYPFSYLGDAPQRYIVRARAI